MPAQTTDTAGVDVGQRQRDQRPVRREQDGGVQIDRRALVGAARPGGAQLQRQVLGLGVGRPGEHVDLPPLVHRHLQQQMAGGAEPVDAQLLGGARQAIGPVADEPGAQPGGDLHIVDPSGSGNTKRPSATTPRRTRPVASSR